MQRAKSYWDAIQPREVEEVEPLAEAAEIHEEELAAMGILSREGFLKDLGDLWEELQAEEQQDYWSFVRRGNFQDVVQRAYGVSFLVSYGYADLLGEEGKWKLQANIERMPHKESVSVAVAIRREAVDG